MLFYAIEFDGSVCVLYVPLVLTLSSFQRCNYCEDIKRGQSCCYELLAFFGISSMY